MSESHAEAESRPLYLSMIHSRHARMADSWNHRLDEFPASTRRCPSATSWPDTRSSPPRSPRMASTPAAEECIRWRTPGRPGQVPRRGPPDLDSALRGNEAHSLVPPTMSIREIRRRFPATTPVFERSGWATAAARTAPTTPRMVRDRPPAGARRFPSRPPRRRRTDAAAAPAAGGGGGRAFSRRTSSSAARPDTDARRDGGHGQPDADRGRRGRPYPTGRSTATRRSSVSSPFF